MSHEKKLFRKLVEADRSLQEAQADARTAQEARDAALMAEGGVDDQAADQAAEALEKAERRVERCRRRLRLLREQMPEAKRKDGEARQVAHTQEMEAAAERSHTAKERIRELVPQLTEAVDELFAARSAHRVGARRADKEQDRSGARAHVPGTAALPSIKEFGEPLRRAMNKVRGAREDGFMKSFTPDLSGGRALDLHDHRKRMDEMYGGKKTLVHGQDL